MATKKTTAQHAELDDETQYSVSLLKPIRVGRSWLRPGVDVVMKGKLIKENADVVGAIQPIAS